MICAQLDRSLGLLCIGPGCFGRNIQNIIGTADISRGRIKMDQGLAEGVDLKTYCKMLPKIELHAHLNGSLSDTTILRLLQDKRSAGVVNLPDSAEVVIKRGHNRTLEDCFTVFGILHCLTDSVSAIETITRDVLQDFVADNVRYLELRTTPKVIPGKMTKEQYIEAVLNVMIEEMQRSNIIVRLLLSIDRARGVSDAWDTLQIAKKYKNMILNETETLAVLKSALIDRIGHGSYIHHESSGSLEMVEMVKQQNIPIEICVSSNIMSGTVKNVADHHFKHWRKEGHPVIICTDDKGVFNTTLSEEFLMCAEAFNLSTSDLASLCLDAVNSTFVPQEERDRLHLLIQGELLDLQEKTTGKVLAAV
ncbi:adenosine deaminase-like protein isoform X4 [Macrobrachium rosenbergii]|uniref:adenosine deaminase-like protein isoform X4 n=1 Tax=Macrobrachium rosenbergii TaxID=79674 RepID=UPI0034D410A7